MRKTLFPFLPLLILAGCNNSDTKEPVGITNTEKLVGEWNNISLKVTVNSKNNSAADTIIEVDRPQWAQTLQIKPIRTYFRTDSTWNSAHYNLKDSLVYNPSGTWRIEKDKLVMLQNFPSPDTTIFALNINIDTASFEGKVDWDMDGKKDDVYFGKQVKVSQ